jgi:hypothetical protein
VTINFNWPLVGSVLSALAGIAGTVLTPTLGANLSSNIQAVLLAVSGLLLAIPAHQAAMTASHRSQTKYAAKLAATPKQVPSL